MREGGSTFAIMRSDKFYVYILTNMYNSVLYTGITNNLIRRCEEHKSKTASKFTAMYNVYKLVYYEEFDGPMVAIKREKEIKGKSREKKNALIQAFNPGWLELHMRDAIIRPH